MDKAISQIEVLVGNVLSDYSFVDKNRISFWIKKGDYLNSEVEIMFEEAEINYDLKYFLEKEDNELLKLHEIFVFLHEISHIIILEKIRTKKGSKAVQNYIDDYNNSNENLNKMIKESNWNDEKSQEEYEKIKFEKQTNELALKLYNRYVRIASS
ncbi:hypothetical protein AAGG74_14650 [Bacillus mexicanus]|uniref:hypothetical protein n=1 Tax=Bacillus mexicanus TaxID=2834415 RepID=UPI003D1910B4